MTFGKIQTERGEEYLKKSENKHDFRVCEKQEIYVIFFYAFLTFPHFITKLVLMRVLLGGFLVTTAWRVLRLRMEETPPGMEGSCEYIKEAVADSRQGVALQLGFFLFGGVGLNPH
jgi:hypothetical protein